MTKRQCEFSQSISKESSITYFINRTWQKTHGMKHVRSKVLHKLRRHCIVLSFLISATASILLQYSHPLSVGIFRQDPQVHNTFGECVCHLVVLISSSGISSRNDGETISLTGSNRKSRTFTLYSSMICSIISIGSITARCISCHLLTPKDL